MYNNIGEMESDESGKTERRFAREIAERFGFRSLDDATLNLNKVLRHFKQEKLEGKFSCPDGKIVYYVHEYVSSGRPEERPVGYCGHFSRLLAEMGNSLSHECSIVVCHPDYLDGHHHFIVHDLTEGKFRDPSIYRVAFNGKKWVPVGESGLDRSNIPEGILNIGIELPRVQYRQHDWLARDFSG